MQEESFHEGFLGIGLRELEAMNDLELAQYQARWNSGDAQHILAEKEWHRRSSIKLMREQFSFAKLKNFIFLLLCMVPLLAKAEVSILDGSGRIYISGEIKKGDYAKFVNYVSILRSSSVSLNSVGGDLHEAIKIAELINELRYSTEVGANSICASACFFIWINGNNRISNSYRNAKIGLHRPYLVEPVNTSDSLRKQTQVMLAATRYIESKFIPKRLIDLMISKSSRDAYFLTVQDLLEIGTERPDLKELFISKCGADSMEVWKKMTEAENAGNAAIYDKLRLNYEKVSDCESDLNIAARRDVIARLKQGWHPSTELK